MNPQTKLAIELAALIILDIIAFFFVKALPDNPVSIDYLVEEAEEPGESGANRDRENTQVERREEPVEIEMTQQHKEL